MDKGEFLRWFNSQVQARWSKVTFSRVDIDDWFVRFGSFDTESLTLAVQRYRLEDDPARPKIVRIYSLLKSIPHVRKRLKVQRTSRFVPMCVQCVEHSELQYPGRFVLWQAAFDGDPTEKQLRLRSEQIADKYIQAYGGRWECLWGESELKLKQRAVLQRERLRQMKREQEGAE